MNFLADYFLKNIFLLCLSFGVIFMVLQSHHSKRKTVIMPILIVSTAMLLSILRAVEEWANKNPNLLFLATLCCFLGFALRPTIIFYFIRLLEGRKPVILRIAIALLIINALIYATSLFLFWDPFHKAAFHYGSDLAFNRGPLYFSTYFITGIMIAYVIYSALVSLQGKHRHNAIASLICVGFIGIAVVLETMLLSESLLNTMIAISCLFYVVHIYQQAGRRDPLTNLYNRGSFYDDVKRFGSSVRSLLIVDMNGLKPINDELGHAAGDRALKTISRVLSNCRNKKTMYVYRMGGDEFEVLNLSEDEGSIVSYIESVRHTLQPSGYTVSIGYAYRQNGEESISEIGKRAEAMMYEDKALYYEKSGKQRRRG